jgi:hypothetical protein
MTEIGGPSSFEGHVRPIGRLQDPFPLVRIGPEPVAARGGGAKRPPPRSRPVPSRIRVDPGGHVLVEVPVEQRLLDELEDVSDSGGELLGRVRIQNRLERSAVALSALAQAKRPPKKPSRPVWTIIRKSRYGEATLVEIALPNRVVRSFGGLSGSDDVVVVKLLPSDVVGD